MESRDPLTIVRVPLDADTAEGENVGSCRGTLEYAGKPRRAIPTMDTLDRIARRRIGDLRWSPVRLAMLTVNMPGLKNFSHGDETVLLMVARQNRDSREREIDLEQRRNATLYSSNERRKLHFEGIMRKEEKHARRVYFEKNFQ